MRQRTSARPQNVCETRQPANRLSQAKLVGQLQSCSIRSRSGTQPVRLRMLATAIIACAVIFTVPTRTHAQDSSPSQVAPSQDPSELAPAPSTWKGAIADSLRLLLLEHTTRVAFQHKTRRELDGPFFGDYVRSLKIPDTWGDGDSWAINYVGHPIHGAASDSSGSTTKTALTIRSSDSRRNIGPVGVARPLGRPCTACNSSSAR